METPIEAYNFTIEKIEKSGWDEYSKVEKYKVIRIN